MTEKKKPLFSEDEYVQRIVDNVLLLTDICCKKCGKKVLTRVISALTGELDRKVDGIDS
jgi:hypothetical protein